MGPSSTPEFLLLMDDRQYGAASLFLQNIYVLLTHRPLKIQMPSEHLPAIPTFIAFDPTDLKDVPRFTLPTTSRLIQTIPQSELVITKDVHETKQKIRAVVAWQKEAMRKIRTQAFSEFEQEFKESNKQLGGISVLKHSRSLENLF